MKIESRPVLLDVNVLVALFGKGHIHHRAAHAWFATARGRGWRTSVVTENGLLRILSNPNVAGFLPTQEIAIRFEKSKALGMHEFWKTEFSFAGWLSQQSIMIPSSMITDGYLLRTAIERRGTLATFDKRIALSLVGSTDSEALEYVPI